MADPANALEELRACTEAAMAWSTSLRAMATGLQAGDFADSEALRAELLILERAQDRCTEVLGKIARLEIEDRLARLEAAGEDVRHLFDEPGDDRE